MGADLAAHCEHARNVGINASLALLPREFGAQCVRHRRGQAFASEYHPPLGLLWAYDAVSPATHASQQPFASARTRAM